MTSFSRSCRSLIIFSVLRFRKSLLIWREIHRPSEFRRLRKLAGVVYDDVTISLSLGLHQKWTLLALLVGTSEMNCIHQINIATSDVVKDFVGGFSSHRTVLAFVRSPDDYIRGPVNMSMIRLRPSQPPDAWLEMSSRHFEIDALR